MTFGLCLASWRTVSLPSPVLPVTDASDTRYVVAGMKSQYTSSDDHNFAGKVGNIFFRVESHCIAVACLDCQVIKDGSVGLEDCYFYLQAFVRATMALVYRN